MTGAEPWNMEDVMKHQNRGSEHKCDQNLFFVRNEEHLPVTATVFLLNLSALDDLFAHFLLIIREIDWLMLIVSLVLNSYLAEGW